MPKIGWNGAVKQSSFGMKREGNQWSDPGEKKDDLATSLLKWNTSAATPVGRPDDPDDHQPTDHSSRSTFSPADEYQVDKDDRHGRRLRPGDRARESRGFEALRRNSDTGEITFNRNIRHGSKKGKEREHDQRPSLRDSVIRKADKPRRTVEKAKEAEKEVYIPSTVTVSRLADIFGVKICEVILHQLPASGLCL